MTIQSILAGAVLTLILEAVLLPVITGVSIPDMVKVIGHERTRLRNKAIREKKSQQKVS